MQQKEIAHQNQFFYLKWINDQFVLQNPLAHLDLLAMPDNLEDLDKRDNPDQTEPLLPAAAFPAHQDHQDHPEDLDNLDPLELQPHRQRPVPPAPLVMLDPMETQAVPVNPADQVNLEDEEVLAIADIAHHHALHLATKHKQPTALLIFIISITIVSMENRRNC